MSLIEFGKPTSEQEKLLRDYRDKWRAIALLTEPIDCKKATQAVFTVYEYISKKKPKILFFAHPYLALKAIFTELKEQLVYPLGETISEELHYDLYMIYKFGRQNVWGEGDSVYWQIIEQIARELNIELDLFAYRDRIDPCLAKSITPIRPESWINDASYFDFCISEDNNDFWRRETIISLSLFENCGWIFPFEDICIICDRPCKLSLDDRQRLHAEGEPAIQFADGYSFYSYHGVTLPEKYGKVHPHQWQAQWLLEEDNAELRRVLIQGIGYSRICQQLQATELNSWQEYTLIRIDADIDGVDDSYFDEIGAPPQKEPIYLLKMTCPSTGFIHALRVPPNIKSAREAITWVNWGIDPKEFSTQT